MNSQLSGTITLSGQNAKSFAMSLYKPSNEAILKHNQLLDKIDDSVKIRNTEDGFQADIADLDLSFLDKQIETININFEAEMENVSLFTDTKYEDVSFCNKTIKKSSTTFDLSALIYQNYNDYLKNVSKTYPEYKISSFVGYAS